jgi:hypothetical protein
VREAFESGESVPVEGDLRQRFTDVGNNHRVVGWRVARDMFEREPLRGSGAGTFRVVWERERPEPLRINDAHSLYLELAGELGVVGLALLAVALAALLAAGARGLRGPERAAHAAFLAAAGALLVHAAIDWDWEMPAVFAWFFAAGAAAAAAAPRVARPGPRRVPRIVAGLACLVLAVTPALVAASQPPLTRGVEAFERGDCAGAIDGALDSLAVLRTRPEPFELLGYCDLRGGRPELAVAAMRSALRRDPENWRYAYGVAVAEALAGRDPRAAAALAHRLNPLERLAAELDRDLGETASRARWRRIAARARLPTE